MNQGKLDVVKQEMARVNIDISGINELKLTGMVKFNSDDHYIYYWVQKSLRRNGVVLTANKRVWNAVLECNLLNDRMILVSFQDKQFNIIVNQVYAPTTNAKETEVERFCEDLQDLLELTPKKDILFNKGGGIQSKKPRDSWSNRQVLPWSIKWSRAKANRVLSRECTDHSKCPLQTTQETNLHMDITRWLIPKSD